MSSYTIFASDKGNNRRRFPPDDTFPQFRPVIQGITGLNDHSFASFPDFCRMADLASACCMVDLLIDWPGGSTTPIFGLMMYTNEAFEELRGFRGTVGMRISWLSA